MTDAENKNSFGRSYERKVKIVFSCIAAVVLTALYFVLSDLTVRVAPDPRAPQSPQTTPNNQVLRGVAQGIVTAIVERDGSNYARVEYPMPDINMNCFFHEDAGLHGYAPYYFVGQKVEVTYDPSAADSCGTSKIGP